MSLNATKKRNQKGFTLIEIIVVMLIIGILAVSVGPKILGRVDDAKVVKVKQDINAINSAITLFRLDTSNYPENLKELDGKYLPRLPKDPWGEPYIYDAEEGTISTLGADKEAGGEGANADLNSAEL